jgi:hypothetical protein
LERQFAVADEAQKMFRDLEKISQSTQPHRTLLAPQPGGPIFITAKEIRHPESTVKRKNTSVVLPMQADINAAVNLALRAVAHPSCADIHHRLRSERKKAVKGQPDSLFAREKRRFGNEKVELLPEKGNDLPKNTNFFFDEHHVASFGRARLAGDESTGFAYASGPGLWKTVNDRIKQWKRCASINSYRMAQWNKVPEDDVPM